jgi:hypothetical protein
MRAHFGMDGEIQSVDLAGQNLLTHGTTTSDFSTTIALSADAVYWMSSGFIGMQGVEKAGLIGTTPSPLADVSDISNMALGDDAMFVVSGFSGQQKVSTITLADGKLTDLYSGPEVDARSMAAVGTTVYFAGDEALYELAAGASKPTKLLETKSGIGYVVADTSGVYVSLVHGDFGQGFVVKVK